ncbi:PspC domain-containing protein [Eubacteriaceae bacterium ES3]|nr:PspC domain-containing protein [Eubacteriaceae bacterium ES3]
MKKHLIRKKDNAILAGVCSGLGDYFGITPWIFRIIFIVPVLPFFMGFWAGVISIVVYLLLAFNIPGNTRRIKDGEIVEVDYEIIDDENDPNE